MRVARAFFDGTPVFSFVAALAAAKVVVFAGGECLTGEKAEKTLGM